MAETKESKTQQAMWRITKASTLPDGTMTWQATTTKFSRDVQKDLVTKGFYEEAINRFKAGTTPPPFFSVAHYPCEKTCVCGYVYKSVHEYSCANCSRERLIAGVTTDIYIDGDQPKAKGIFFPTMLGKSVFESCKSDIQNNTPIEDRVRISMGFYPDSDGVIYKSEGRDFMKGWIEHYAATRVPVVPETELEVKSLNIRTKYDDAAAIVPKHLADQLEDLEKLRRIGKSGTDPELVVKSDRVAPTKNVTQDVTAEDLNAKATQAIKKLKQAVEDNPAKAALEKSKIDEVLLDAAETLSIVQKAILAPGGDKKEILSRASNLIQAINDYAQSMQAAPDVPGAPGAYAAQPNMYGQQIPAQPANNQQKPQEPPVQPEAQDSVQTNADQAQNSPELAQDQAEANSQDLTDQTQMESTGQVDQGSEDQQMGQEQVPAEEEDDGAEFAMSDEDTGEIDAALAEDAPAEEAEPVGEEAVAEEDAAETEAPAEEAAAETEEPAEEEAAEEEAPAEDDERSIMDAMSSDEEEPSDEEESVEEGEEPKDEEELDSALADDDATTDFDRQKKLKEEPNEEEASDDSMEALDEEQPSDQEEEETGEEDEEEEEDVKGNKLRFVKKSRTNRIRESLKSFSNLEDWADIGSDDWVITDVSAKKTNRTTSAISQYLDEWGSPEMEEISNSYAFTEDETASAEEEAIEQNYADEFLDTRTGVNSVDTQPDLPNGWASVGDRYISQAGYRGRSAEIMIERGQKWRVIRHPGTMEELKPRHITVMDFGEALDLASEWLGGPLPSAAPERGSIPVAHTQIAYEIDEERPTSSSDVVKARTRPNAAVKSSAEHPARAYMDRWGASIAETIRDAGLSRVEKREKVQKALEKFGTEIVELINKATPISQPDVEVVVEKAVQDAVAKVQAERDQKIADLEAQVKSLIETAVQGQIKSAIAQQTGPARRRSFGALRPPDAQTVSKSTADLKDAVAVPVLGGDTQQFKRFSASELAKASVLAGNPLRY